MDDEMIKLGEIQELEIVKKVEFGVYLADPEGDPEERILLPGKQVSPDAEIGDEIEVFVYRDSKDRLIATINKPKLTLGEIALLKVAETGTIGAFLDWGLEKELLLPFREQTKKVETGQECLVALYIDKSSRLCATMNVYPYLHMDSSYKKDDKVEGRIYEISREFGAFVAVDDIYSGMIPARETMGDLQIGEWITARVANVKEDGKLDLSVREKAYIQMDEDAQEIFEEMERRGGILDFTDKASPEQIKEEMGMSKNEFKRAIGRLYKMRKIEIMEDCIKIIEFCANKE